MRKLSLKMIISLGLFMSVIFISFPYNVFAMDEKVEIEKVEAFGNTVTITLNSKFDKFDFRFCQHIVSSLI